MMFDLPDAQDHVQRASTVATAVLQEEVLGDDNQIKTRKIQKK
jgi:hypothetical protein